jgi:hypothetical protein
MNQTPLFFDDVDDALRHVVSVLGGPKRVGPLLRGDELPTDRLAQWVSDCLNADRPAQFHPHQVLVLLRAARQVGDHTAMAWLAGEAGYQAVPVEPEDEAAELQRKFIETGQMMRKMAERIEALHTRASLKAVG